MKISTLFLPPALSCSISAGVKLAVCPTRVHSIRILAGGGSNILILSEVSAASRAGAAGAAAAAAMNNLRDTELSAINLLLLFTSVAVCATPQNSNSGNTVSRARPIASGEPALQRINGMGDDRVAALLFGRGDWRQAAAEVLKLAGSSPGSPGRLRQPPIIACWPMTRACRDMFATRSASYCSCQRKGRAMVCEPLKAAPDKPAHLTPRCRVRSRDL